MPQDSNGFARTYSSTKRASGDAPKATIGAVEPGDVEDADEVVVIVRSSVASGFRI